MQNFFFKVKIKENFFKVKIQENFLKIKIKEKLSFAEFRF